MATEPETELDLDALLAEARQERPSPDLTARVLADADTTQADAATALAPTPSRPVGGGGLFGFLGAIGGWAGMSGVTAAGVLGLSIGYYAPDAVETVIGTDLISYIEGDSFVPDYSDLWVGDGDV